MNEKLSITHIKVLETVSYLNKMHAYPLSDGIFKILNGIIDEETTQYKNCPTFATLISFNSKKVCHYILYLTRHNYLKKIYHAPTNKLYYSTTEFGEMELLNYHKKHKVNFASKSKAFKQTIIKL